MADLRELLETRFDSLRYERVLPTDQVGFREPVYWDELLRSQPSFLLGARGTGKTTALRAMDYQGWRANHTADDKVPFIGVYWKFSTSVTHAFTGNSIADDEWVSVFQYYVNLMLVHRLIETIETIESDIGRISISDNIRLWSRLGKLIALGSNFEYCDYRNLRYAIEDRIDDIQIWINDPCGQKPKMGAPAGEPINVIVNHLWGSKQLRNTPVYFLLDEFENLLDYQQVVFNTLLKHSGDSHYTFKIGVRPRGRRVTATLNHSEIVSDPADYKLIDIDRYMSEEDGKAFEKFASSVCEERLNLSCQSRLGLIDLFPGLSWEEEACKYKETVQNRAESLREQLLASNDDPDYATSVNGLSAPKLCFIADWVAQHDADEKQHDADEKLSRAVREFLGPKSSEWNTRINNYGYAWLFTIAKQGVRIRKYYCGWKTLCRIAGGNIRFLLDIVRVSLTRHDQRKKTLADPVSVECQTLAVQDIGEVALDQLHYASQYGPKLRWLALGVGTLFGHLAEQGLRHSPEVGSFGLSQAEGVLPAERQVVEDLLSEAAAHQLFTPVPRNKREKNSTVPTDDVYRMHPIFAPRFLFTHRSKRLMELTYRDLRDLSSDPRNAVREVLTRHTREDTIRVSDETLF